MSVENEESISDDEMRLTSRAGAQTTSVDEEESISDDEMRVLK